MNLGGPAKVKCKDKNTKLYADKVERANCSAVYFLALYE